MERTCTSESLEPNSGVAFSAMRRLVCVLALSWGGCDAGPISFVTGTLSGMAGGSQLDAKFRVGSKFMGISNFGGTGANAFASTNNYLSETTSQLEVKGFSTAVTSVSVNFSQLPPSPIWAGPYRQPRASILFQNGTDDVLEAVFDARDPMTLVFNDVDFAGSQERGTIMKGTFSGEVHSIDGTLSSSGSFELVAVCNRSDRYFRLCGNQAIEPTKGPFIENDCPEAVTAHFAGAPAVADSTAMALGGVQLKCDGDQEPLCFGVAAVTDDEGCRWRAKVLTDPGVRQLAIAGWVEASCSRSEKYCNAWR